MITIEISEAISLGLIEACGTSRCSISVQPISEAISLGLIEAADELGGGRTQGPISEAISLGLIEADKPRRFSSLPE